MNLDHTLCWQLSLLFFAHWLGDFFAQSDQMAAEKSKSNAWLLLHVTIYTSTVTLLLLVGGVITSEVVPGFYFWTLSLHFVTDWFTSRLNARLYKAEERHWFFVSIGFDQFLHAVALCYTLKHFKS